MEGNIKYETILDISLINQTAKGKKIVKEMSSRLTGDEVWVIKSWGVRFSLRNLVDLLFKNGLDVFDVEYGSVTRIYVCLLDAYRINNRVVYQLQNEAQR